MASSHFTSLNISPDKTVERYGVKYYVIEVVHNHHGNFKIQRRYTEFLHLYNNIALEFPGISNFDFPPKNSFRYFLYPSGEIKTRCERFTKLLELIISISHAVPIIFLDFLNIRNIEKAAVLADGLEALITEEDSK